MRYGKALAMSVIALVMGLAAVGISAAEPADKDNEAMQGEWTIESLTFHGNQVEAAELTTWRRVVEKNHVIWRRGEETLLELDIKFDASQKPKTLDSTVATGDQKGQVTLAIYELEGDVLRVCFADPGQPRPTDYSSNAGSLQGMYTAKRVKKP